eukprot:1606777-Amphidinium_carterae.1
MRMFRSERESSGLTPACVPKVVVTMSPKECTCGVVGGVQRPGSGCHGKELASGLYTARVAERLGHRGWRWWAKPEQRVTKQTQQREQSGLSTGQRQTMYHTHARTHPLDSQRKFKEIGFQET